MKKYYQKLVRDKVPEMLRAQGIRYDVTTIPLEEFENYLAHKLKEEVVEYGIDRSEDELADVYAVFMTILEHKGLTLSKIRKIASEKAATKGLFFNRIMLVWTDDETNSNR